MKGRGRKERRNNNERGKDSVVPPGPLVEEVVTITETSRRGH